MSWSADTTGPRDAALKDVVGTLEKSKAYTSEKVIAAVQQALTELADCFDPTAMMRVETSGHIDGPVGNAQIRIVTTRVVI